MDALTSAIVEDYEYYLRGNGLTQNTSSFYIRILRAAYNRASEEEGFERENPFCRVYTGVDKTVKRAIPLNAVPATANACVPFPIMRYFPSSDVW